MKITKSIPEVESKQIDVVNRCKSLLDECKPLPFKEEVEHYIKLRKFSNSGPEKIVVLSLRLFGNYLEERNVIYPTKGDAIDFFFKQKDELDGFELDLFFASINGFVNYSRNNFHKLFGGLFAGTTITRRINFTNGPLIVDDETTYQI